MADNQLGTVSNTSTPLSGSLENLGGGELLRKTHTPTQPRRSGRFAPNQDSPLVLSDQRNTDTLKPKVPTTEDMDDWELKLLGKKGVPFTPSEFKSQRDNLSMISGMSSANSGGNGNGGASVGGGGNLSSTSSRNNTLERTSRTNTLERPTRLLPQQTPSGHKKKIIPVHSDFESSPSPEDSPCSPSDSRDNSPVKEFVNRPSPVIEEESKNKKILGKFTKTSIRGMSRSGS